MSSYLDDNYLLGAGLGVDQAAQPPLVVTPTPPPSFFEATVNVPGLGPVKLKAVLAFAAIAGLVWWYLKRRKKRK